MSLLMKKLDHLSDGIQDGQGADSSQTDEEPCSAAVSHFKSTRPKSGLFIWRLAQRIIKNIASLMVCI